jgi:hypothetical protein
MAYFSSLYPKSDVNIQMNEKKRDGSLEWPQSGSNVLCEDSANGSCREEKLTNINTDNNKTTLEEKAMTFEQLCLEA